MTLNVTVYSKPRCQQCTAVKRKLRDSGVPFKEDDATETGNAEAIKALGYMQAPVTIWTDSGPGDERHFSGFHVTELDKIIAAHEGR